MKRSVLIIGFNIQNDLVDQISKFGFLPSLINTLESAIKKIRYEKFSAIVIDRRYDISIDILEFILNVRDYNQSIPIYIIGKSKSPREDEIIAGQKATHIVNMKELLDYLKKI